MRKKIQIIPGIMWLPLIITLVCNTIAYNGTRLFMSDKVHYNLSNGLDDRIPFVDGCHISGLLCVLGCKLYNRLQAGQRRGIPFFECGFTDQTGVFSLLSFSSDYKHKACN